MENTNPGNIDHNYLADLIDDFTPAELVSLLNWLAVSGYKASRANISYFRSEFLDKWAYTRVSFVFEW